MITAFAVDRYEPVYGEDEQITGYVASDVGDHVWVNLKASVSNVAPAGTPLNSLHYTLDVTQGEIQALSSITGNAGGTSINLVNDRTILTDAADIASTYTYTLTVYDDAGYSAVQYDTVVPGRANFSLAPSKYGACFGGIAKGTQANPLLESYYLAKFYAGIDVDPNWVYPTVNSGVTTPGSYGNGRLRVGRIGRARVRGGQREHGRHRQGAVYASRKRAHAAGRRGRICLCGMFRRAGSAHCDGRYDAGIEAGMGAQPLGWRSLYELPLDGFEIGLLDRVVKIDRK